MNRKDEIEALKNYHADNLNKIATANPKMTSVDNYFAYYVGRKYASERCYGHLTQWLATLTKDEYEWTLYPLRFNRRLRYFDYTALFDELNHIFGYYFRLRRYYSGYRYLRLIDIYPINKPPIKLLWWNGIYNIFLLLRKINIQYWNNWEAYFKRSGRKNPVDNWHDIIAISEKNFGDKKYYLHNDLYKMVYSVGDDANYAIIDRWIDDYLSTLYKVFGQGHRGKNNTLHYHYNSLMINELKMYANENKEEAEEEE